MKRRKLLNFMFCGLVATAAAMTPVLTTTAQAFENDDDRLDRLVADGTFIQDECFYITNTHDFNGKPIFLRRCKINLLNKSRMVVNTDSMIIDNVFDYVNS